MSSRSANDIIARSRRLTARTSRRVLLGLARRLAATAELLRGALIKLEILLDGADQTIAVKPLADIPAPQIDMRIEDPTAAIMASAEFAAATGFFADNPAIARSLVSAQAQALLYCLLRNLRPDHVFEIGTYRAGTTEAICRALHANGRGRVHTADPFADAHVGAVFKQWPPALLRHVQLYPLDSMAFYSMQERNGVRPGLVFVDGNHDYEFALFDIGCAARALTPGGFIFVDNVAQVGPFFAARDFLSTNAGWRALGSPADDYDRDRAFDRRRAAVAGTDFMVLRAPASYWIDERPRNFGLIRWGRNSIRGVRCKVLPLRRPGKLVVQVVFRGFGVLQPVEISAVATLQLPPAGDVRSLSIAFTPPAEIAGDFAHFTVEPWLIWRGEEPLQLAEPPEPY